MRALCVGNSDEMAVHCLIGIWASRRRSIVRVGLWHDNPQRDRSGLLCSIERVHESPVTG